MRGRKGTIIPYRHFSPISSLSETITSMTKSMNAPSYLLHVAHSAIILVSRRRIALFTLACTVDLQHPLRVQRDDCPERYFIAITETIATYYRVVTAGRSLRKRGVMEGQTAQKYVGVVGVMQTCNI